MKAFEQLGYARTFSSISYMLENRIDIILGVMYNWYIGWSYYTCLSRYIVIDCKSNSFDLLYFDAGLKN